MAAGLSDCALEQLRTDLVFFVRVGHRNSDVGEAVACWSHNGLTNHDSGIAISRNHRESRFRIR
jgi:hypothetical protein